MTAPAAIETRDLTRVFHEPRGLLQRTTRRPQTAVDGLSMRIEPGECVALVGPNGAGKSTLLRMLSTSIAPTSGDAWVAGHSVVSEGGRVRGAIGVMTGDDRSFFWRLTALDNLLFFGRLQGLETRACRARALELLDRLGLAGAADQRFAGYSAGMRQRLSIARAVLHRPRVLLLDEPTAALDIEHRGQVLELLRDSLRPDGAALIASHDAGLAASLAGRVVRLEHGRAVSDRASGVPSTYSVRVRGLTAATSQALGAVEAARDGCADLLVSDLGDGHALAATLAGVVAAGGEILDVRGTGAPAGSERPER